MKCRDDLIKTFHTEMSRLNHYKDKRLICRRNNGREYYTVFDKSIPDHPQRYIG